MKIIFRYTLLFCIFTSISFAQDLFVSNNINVPIFVDGTGFDDTIAGNVPLYVTDNIELEGANSYIYLRNEGQLIQGNEVLFNSGLGQLSIYQNGTVSEFNFNYWCSPVGNTLGPSDALNRDFIPENNIYDVDTTDPNDITSNLAAYTATYDGTTAPLVISTRWLFTYDPGSFYADWDYLGQSGTALSGRGFSMKGTNAPGPSQLYDFRGKPNTGTFSAPVSAPIGPDLYFTLVGNPYPSAMDAYDFIHDVNNRNVITGVLQYWQQNSSSHILNSYVGGYGLYTIDEITFAESWTPAPRGTYNSDGSFNGNLPGNVGGLNPGVDAPGRYIPIGQGFMIEGTATDVVYFRNSFRDYIKESSTASFFYEANSNSLTVGENTLETSNADVNTLIEEFLRFRLMVDLQTGENYYSRQLLMNLVDHATNGYDYGLEAKLPELTDSDAYWTFDDLPYAIQAFKYSLDLKIPLVIKAYEQQNVRFRMIETINFNEDQPIYIHDIENELFIDLREQHYEVTLEEGHYPDRFEITFTNQETFDDPEATISDFKVFQDNVQSQLTILNPNNLDLRQVQLHDMAGKLIFDFSHLNTQSDYYFSTRHLSDGVYVASLNIDNQNPIQKKIIIKK